MTDAEVAVVGCRRVAEGDPTDLYPDADAAPLQAALLDLGADSAMVSWDDPEVEWSGISHVALSSTWDSVDRPDEFLPWTRALSAVTRLVNSVDLVEWNIDKGHQQELDAARLPVIPTTWIAPAICGSGQRDATAILCFLEVELIDPYLSLDMEPAAARLGRAILAL